MTKKFFPIHTDTSCQWKWAWSTVNLSAGLTSSCCKTTYSELTEDNFLDFHNTPAKIADRVDMLNGHWPATNCGYCKNVELASPGALSERAMANQLTDLSPPELYENQNLVNVDPTVVEVYFNNTCNFGCLYCNERVSSYINHENSKFGRFDQGGVVLESTPSSYKALLPKFWEWFETGFGNLRRFHVVGGEAFYQKELDVLLEKIDQHPNPNCEFSVITNLSCPTEVLEQYVDKVKHLLAKKKLKRIDITCSIDCWGTEQEYVRYGLDLAQWERNFEYLLKQKWLYLIINQTVSVLTIKTMPELLTKLAEWRKQHKVHHTFSKVSPGPSYMKHDILGASAFENDIPVILSRMPSASDADITTKNLLAGLLTVPQGTVINNNEVKKLFVFLDEKDRRRGTSWEQTFPWLAEYRNVV